jgi:nucleotide-binding universal stress UspA family protein
MSIYTPAQRTKVLVALDGSPAAARALPVARTIAAQLDATIAILYSTTAPVPPADLRRRLGLDQRDAEVRLVRTPRGIPAEGILQASTDPEVALLVLTTHGRDISEGPRLGRVAEAVVAGSVGPLLLVPPETAPASSTARPVLRHLLLPLDGTPATATALQPATALANQLGASVDLLYVAAPGEVPPAEPGSIAAPRYVDQPQHEWPHWANEVIARLCMGCAACPPDVPVRMFLGHGPVGAAIAHFAADQQVDIIVLVRRSHLEAGRARVLREVLHRAPCPILLLSGPPG